MWKNFFFFCLFRLCEEIIRLIFISVAKGTWGEFKCTLVLGGAIVKRRYYLLRVLPGTCCWCIRLSPGSPCPPVLETNWFFCNWTDPNIGSCLIWPSPSWTLLSSTVRWGGSRLLHLLRPCLSLFIFIVVWLYCLAYEILVPQPGIEPRPSAVKVQSLNHWTTREFPTLIFKVQSFAYSLTLPPCLPPSLPPSLPFFHPF